MNIPVVLPVLGVQVDKTGRTSLTLDGEPYGGDGTSREGIPTVIRNLANELGGPVRVEVTEADGTRYVDIAVPPPTDDLPVATPPTQHTAAIGGPFVPGEDVALAYLVGTRPADSDGVARPCLPLALLADQREHLVLVGMRSGAVMRMSEGE